MKYIFITGFVLLSCKFSLAQNATEALRYSFISPGGSARVQAIGGTNISLGGDISSVFINPAGLAQFKTNEFVFSPGFLMNKAKLNYNDSSFKGKRNAVNYGTSGIIFSQGNRFKSSNLRNTTISIALNQAANYNSDFFYSGRNLKSSYSEKWVEELVYFNVQNIDDALKNFPTGASMAFESYLIDTLPGYVGYRTNADISKMPLDQSFSYKTRGGFNEAALAVAWNSKEKFLGGLTIGIPIINYSRETTVIEKDGTSNTNNDFESFHFSETFSTKGAGFNLKLGVIFKPVEYFRLGITFHSPSLLTLTDRTNVTLTSNIENYSKRINNDNTKPTTYTYSTHDYTDGNDYTYKYMLLTAWKLGVSASYVFREIKDVTKQKAFITADAELVNYKSMSYSSNEETPTADEEAYFKNINQSIDDLYKMAVNARIGGELKFKTFMVRGGFNFMGSPYQKNMLPAGVKGWKMTPSFGLGYRDKGFFVDLTYAHMLGRDFHTPYILQDSEFPLAKNNFTNGQVVATVGLKF